MVDKEGKRDGAQLRGVVKYDLKDWDTCGKIMEECHSSTQLVQAEFI